MLVGGAGGAAGCFDRRAEKALSSISASFSSELARHIAPLKSPASIFLDTQQANFARDQHSSVDASKSYSRDLSRVHLPLDEFDS